MIGYYRKKPVEIKACQFYVQSPEVGGMSALDIVEWIGEGARFEFDETAIMIETLEGTMRADEGDWIIKGVEGEFYPCKPNIFEATYEAVAFERIDDD